MDKEEEERLKTERLKQLQMADLGIQRREFLSTVDNQRPDDRSLEQLHASRRSEQHHGVAHAEAQRYKGSLNAWKDYHKDLQDSDKRLENIKGGQTHRHHLNVTMMGVQRAQDEAQTKLDKRLAASIQAAAKKGVEMTPGQQPVPPQESPPSQMASKPQKRKSPQEVPKASSNSLPTRGKSTPGTRGRGLFRGPYDSPSVFKQTRKSSHGSSGLARLDPALEKNSVGSDKSSNGSRSTSISKGTRSLPSRQKRPIIPAPSLGTPEDFLAHIHAIGGKTKPPVTSRPAPTEALNEDSEKLQTSNKAPATKPSELAYLLAKQVTRDMETESIKAMERSLGFKITDKTQEPWLKKPKKSSFDEDGEENKSDNQAPKIRPIAVAHRPSEKFMRAMGAESSKSPERSASSKIPDKTQPPRAKRPEKSLFDEDGGNKKSDNQTPATRPIAVAHRPSEKITSAMDAESFKTPERSASSKIPDKTQSLRIKRPERSLIDENEEDSSNMLLAHTPLVFSPRPGKSVFSPKEKETVSTSTAVGKDSSASSLLDIFGQQSKTTQQQVVGSSLADLSGLEFINEPEPEPKPKPELKHAVSSQNPTDDPTVKPAAEPRPHTPEAPAIPSSFEGWRDPEPAAPSTGESHKEETFYDALQEMNSSPKKKPMFKEAMKESRWASKPQAIQSSENEKPRSVSVPVRTIPPTRNSLSESIYAKDWNLYSQLNKAKVIGVAPYSADKSFYRMVEPATGSKDGSSGRSTPSSLQAPAVKPRASSGMQPFQPPKQTDKSTQTGVRTIGPPPYNPALPNLPPDQPPKQVGARTIGPPPYNPALPNLPPDQPPKQVGARTTGPPPYNPTLTNLPPYQPTKQVGVRTIGPPPYNPALRKLPINQPPKQDTSKDNDDDFMDEDGV